MGQPRLRLVNKEPGKHAEDAQAEAGRARRPRTAGSQPAAAPGDDEQGVSQVKDECLRLLKSVKEMEKSGEPVCIAFNKLPPKKEYPDYYLEIKKPIALDIIKGKITRGVYGSVADFVADIDLMCDNAQTYNIPDSYIYEVAGDIRRSVHQLAGIRTPSSEAAAAVAAAATVAAPATGPTPHLKLRIRQTSSPQSEHGSGGSEAPEGEAASHAKKPKSKRKRVQYSDDDDDDEDDDGDEGENDSEAPAAGALSKKDADAALDELFQAIYDADLGKAVKLLDIRNLPIDDYRPVNLGDQGLEEPDGGNYQWAPLHAAACYGRLKVAQLLCRRGAKVEAVDTMHKSTPLAWAAYTNRKRMAKFLVREFNANVNVRNAHGQLPIQIAVDPGHLMWAEFLLPTDGTVVDLPLPEVHEPPPDTRRTPVKKTKAHSQDASTSGAQLATPLGSQQALGAHHGMQQQQQQYQPQQQHLGQLAGAQMQAFMSPQRQAAPMPPSGPPIPQCIGGIGYQEAVHPRMGDAMKDIVAQLEGLTGDDDSGDTRLVDPFEELPDRDEYPEYYEVIGHPMALDLVKKRIAAGYRSFDAFNFDMLWIFNNAMFFNEPESDIYNTAVDLEKDYKRFCREAVQKYQISFDTSYNDAEAADGRYVNRLAVGENDVFVGDFIYVKSDAGRRVAMITRLRVGEPADRRKYIDGRWLLTPSEVPEIAGQPVYPHQLFVGPPFEGLGVRGVTGKCFVLLPNVYSRVYPQVYAPQDLFVCESMYTPAASADQKGTLTALTNWAHDLKTPLMKPPTFIPYIVPFTLQRQLATQWGNVGLLPTLAHTVLNREAAARMQMQNQARVRPASMAAAQGGTPQAATQQQTPAQGMPHAQAGAAAGLRLAGAQQLSAGAQSSFNQAYQALNAHHQQAMAKAQAQLSQRENAIRKQAMEQTMASQQQNPGFIGSAMHQGLMKQQSQLIEQSQQAYFAQLMELQQAFNQQVQALTQGLQQQQQQQLMPQSVVPTHPMSPLSAAQQIGGAFGAVPLSPGMGQAGVSSPVARQMQVSMLPMSPLTSMAMGTNGAVYPAMAGSAHLGVTRPGAPLSPMPTMPMADGSFGGSGGTQPSTPTRASTNTVMGQLGMSSPAYPGANAQTMMAMLLQQKQQQQQQQQPSTPKQTHMPLSPDLPSQSAQQAAVQNQQMFELWTKSTRVFLTHGNARIEKGLALQIATPNASMFMHISLREPNHALRVPESASSVLIRPVPGPFNGSGKVLLSLGVNSRPCLPRIIPDAAAQPSDNGTSDDTPSHISDETDKDDLAAVAALVKSANYAFEVPLQLGMNVVETEVIASEWTPELAAGDGADQQVPPGPHAQHAAQKPTTKKYLLFLTRQ
ncbi:hypothetical protein LPJ61_002940 [Coemansia biformis]|uniref:Bromo domain-containing protein n=1 Tax=Coemansia biformis TaxID=1286918 RepID=A0A9W7YCB9_9FUNG|nr:hypothetical protein LPJ61_002940 [Coemansia biformis]